MHRNIRNARAHLKGLCEVEGRRDSALAAAPSCRRRMIPACRPAILASGKAGEFAWAASRFEPLCHSVRNAEDYC